MINEPFRAGTEGEEEGEERRNSAALTLRFSGMPEGVKEPKASGAMGWGQWWEGGGGNVVLVCVRERDIHVAV